MRNRSARMQEVYSPSLILLLLGGCRGEHTSVFDIGAHRCSTMRPSSTVRKYGRSTVRTLRCSTVRTYGRSMGTGIPIYRYGHSTFFYERANLHVCTYIRTGEVHLLFN